MLTVHFHKVSFIKVSKVKKIPISIDSFNGNKYFFSGLSYIKMIKNAFVISDTWI